MASNEIEERAAFACWVRAGSAGGEGIHVLDPSTLTYRSRVSFQNRIITTVDPSTVPIIILPLDRDFSRRETAVFGCRLGTVQPNDSPLVRSSYPDLGTPPDNVAQIAVQPIHLDWLGPDLSSPLFMPFGFAPQSVPDGFDLDLYNAIAVLLPVVADAAQSGDFCIAGFEHLQPDVVDQPVQQVLPAEPPPVDPIEALLPIAWWRMDDYDTVTDEGGTDVVSFNPRSASQLEGALVLEQEDQSAPLPPDPLFNNQPVYTTDHGSFVLTPASGTSFWDFMGSDNYTTYVVWAPRDTFATSQFLYGPEPSVDTPEFFVEVDPGADVIYWDFGVGGQFDAPIAAAVDVVQLQEILVKPAAQNMTINCTTPGTDGGNFMSPPPGSVLHKLVFFSQSGGCSLSIAEAIFFDRALTAPERAIVVATLTARYGI